ncbi:hypothetical protein ACH37Y_06255 [Sphingomonas paucimobilis]|jgi:hypothetical protein|uniref:hypothetical protein n=1 Tax=Sphingomonas paucimobilis TaxID=13689 RepID=UPI0037B1882F
MAYDPSTARMDKLADIMADGCPSLTDAAYRMRMPVQQVERLWKLIRQGLGAQAR